jgi:hypothetical protein
MMILINPSDFDPRRAVPVSGLLGAYPFLTGPSARAFIFRAEPHMNWHGEMVPGNGLAGAIRRIGGKGGKVLIDPVLFGDWLRAQPYPDTLLTTSQSLARTEHPLKRAAAMIERRIAARDSGGDALRVFSKHIGRGRPRRDDVATRPAHAEQDAGDVIVGRQTSRQRQSQREAAV